jgi:MFS family permease
MFMTCALVFVFAEISSFSPNYAMLLVFETLVGLGLGGNLPVVYSLMVEFLPIAGRGRILAILASAASIGELVASGTAWLVMPSLGWRWLIRIGAVPSVLLMVFFPFVHESPRFLAVAGRAADAWRVITAIATSNSRPVPGGGACVGGEV